MRPGLAQLWLNRLLYRLTLAVAAALGTALVVAPLAPPPPGRDVGSRLLSLLAGDAVVRKTTLAGALGLWTTAIVFFRPYRPYARYGSGYPYWDEIDCAA